MKCKTLKIEYYFCKFSPKSCQPVIGLFNASIFFHSIVSAPLWSPAAVMFHCVRREPCRDGWMCRMPVCYPTSPSSWNGKKASQYTVTRKEGNILFNDALNTFFIYGYMASDIWLRTILIVRKETRCHNIGYSFRLAARVLLYAPSHRQDSTYHGLCYTSRGALAGMRNSSITVTRSRKC